MKKVLIEAIVMVISVVYREANGRGQPVEVWDARRIRIEGDRHKLDLTLVGGKPFSRFRLIGGEVV